MQYSDDETTDPRPRWHILWKCVVVGIVSGLLVCLYRMMLLDTNSFAVKVFRFLRDNPLYIPLWIIAAILAGLLIAWLVRRVPQCSGSGIPQTIGNIKLGHKIRGLPIVVSRFIGGFLASIFGLSLGREGPSVHIGAASAEIMKSTANDEIEHRVLLTAGAAAGLSAAFSAPISGMVFALEEIHHSFSEYVLIAGLTSAVAADIVASFIFGMDPVLNFVSVPAVDINVYLWMIPCGLFAGLLGWLMNFSYMRVRDFFMRFPPKIIIPLVMLCALPVGLLIPEAICGGEHAVMLAESASAGLMFIATLLIVKIAFSVVSFGSGAPGGIFMPILAVGALGGATVGLILVQLGMPVECVCNCAVLCMAATLASSLRTPVTAVLLVVEMTGSLVHLLPVALCVLIGYTVSGLLKTRPIYRLLLTDIMERNPKLNEEAGKPLHQLVREQSQSQ